MRKPREPRELNAAEIRESQVFGALPGGTASMLFPLRPKPYRLIAATVRYVGGAGTTDMLPAIDLVDTLGNTIFARWPAQATLGGLTTIFYSWSSSPWDGALQAIITAALPGIVTGPLPQDCIITPAYRPRLTFTGTVDPLDTIELITLTTSSWLHL